MARTMGLFVLRRALRRALAADAKRQNGAVAAPCVRATRRHFLQLTAAGVSALALGAVPLFACGAKDRGKAARVAIVGAGLAGLLCGYRLKQAGIRATLYDANTRVGGRIWSVRVLSEQVAELGGEFIDTEHRTLRGLAAELGLPLDDVNGPEPGIRPITFHFGGRVRGDTELTQAFRPLAMQMQKDLARSKADPAELRRLDALSLARWLDAATGTEPWLKQLITVAYIGEFGRQAEEQSSLNLLSLIDSQTPEPFRVYGASDERFRTRGGNELFTQKLGDALSTQVELDRRLLRVERTPAGALRLVLERAGVSIAQEFDKVVLALPFSLLRKVELRVELPAQKQRQIRELGYGSNAKLIGRTMSRVWRERHHASGYAISDLPFQSCWDASSKQLGQSGLLTFFLGGRAGAALGDGSAEQHMLGHLRDLDKVFPGTEQAYVSPSAACAHWPSAPLSLGSYACPMPGQASWAASLGAQVGNLHFCGEHTSREFQGYMEGAAESGERAASEVLWDLGIAAKGRPLTTTRL